MEPDEYDLMDEVEHRMWWYRALHARLCDALAGVSGMVLDAGCGTGGLLAVLARVRPDLTAMVVEWAGPAAARAASKSACPVARGSVNALPFADASFDGVLSADVLCHAAVDPAMALGEVRRILRPGGRLVVNMPAFAWLTSAHDRRVHNARRVSASALCDWLRAAGFEDIHTRYWNSLLLPLMVLQRKVVASGHNAASDVAPFPPWLDATLHGVSELERRLRLALPAGGSVLAIALKPTQ
jgi:SAM-dependent methyltransferase